MRVLIDAALSVAVHDRAFRRLTGRILASAVMAELVALAFIVTASAIVVVRIGVDTIRCGICAAINRGIGANVCAGRRSGFIRAAKTLNIGK